MGITVAVTGPTGEIGKSVVDALESEPDVDRIIGMARRPFDTVAAGWVKTEYRQGDILDPAAVADLIVEADVVVHLAYVIMGSHEEAERINLAGSRNVFEAVVAAPRTRRLVYTSSVAAYGYHRDNPSPITEDVAPRGSDEHYYSRQKAQTEALLTDITGGTELEVYVLRPCIVAGPRATALADFMPWNRLADRLSGFTRGAAAALPLPRPLVPDPGVRVQLVHQDDVAAAIAAAALGRGSPGAYNLAGDGEVSFSDILEAVGARGVRVPQALAVLAATIVAHTPRVPAVAEWVQVGRTSVVMDTGKAKRELGWRPRYRADQTLATMAAATRRR